MGTAATIFIGAQALAITLYVGLAAYVVAHPSRRSVDLPFIALCLTQAVDASAHFLLSTANVPATAPDALRLRTGTVILTAVLVLHVAVSTLRGRQRQMGMMLVGAAYAVGATGLLLSGLTDPVIAGAESVSPAAYALRPILSPAGYALVVFCVAINLTTMLSLLTVATWRGFSPRLRSDARHVFAPAFLLSLSFLISSAALGLPLASRPPLDIALGIVQRVLSLAAGLILADRVLRFGSPAGQPVHFSLSPMVLAAAVAVLVDLAPLSYAGHLAAGPYLIPPVLTGLAAGVLLARPETLRLTGRWLGRLPPQESAFSERLRAAWRSLAARETEGLSLEDLGEALRLQIAAAYVEILERTVEPQISAGLVFTHREAECRVHLSLDGLDWPITESIAGKNGHSTRGLPGPASLILPILLEGEVVGILTIGEPERGGIYSRGEVMHAEMLADFLSAACSAGVPLVKRAAARPPSSRPPQPASAPLAIRAFGRMEVISPRNPLVRAPQIPLRARQLLAFLLTDYPEPVAAETLMDRLWPEAPPEMAANSLYVAVYALRRALEPGLPRGEASRYILRQDDAYRLQLDDSISVDIVDFEDAYQRGQHLSRAKDGEAAAAEYAKALALYRGPFLAEAALSEASEVEAVRQKLRRHCGEMARLVARRLVEQERTQEAEALLLSLRHADPSDETFVDLLAQMDRNAPGQTPSHATVAA